MLGPDEHGEWRAIDVDSEYTSDATPGPGRREAGRDSRQRRGPQPVGTPRSSRRSTAHPRN